MAKRKLAIVPESDRRERAEYCTKYLETFEKSYRLWPDLAEILVEVERDELFLELGDKTWDEWATKHAPGSYRLCYIVKRRYANLKAANFTNEELRLMPPETAEWASKAKNISPASLSKPEVKEALMLPRQRAIEVLREALPEQHLENLVRRTCKFAASQDEVIQNAYQSFRLVKDEHASFEEFIEWLCAEFVLSLANQVPE